LRHKTTQPASGWSDTLCATFLGIKNRGKNLKKIQTIEKM
jgi:hypothetical protein